MGRGVVSHPCTAALAVVSALLALALHGLPAVYYALNQMPVPVRDTEISSDSPQTA